MKCSKCGKELNGLDVCPDCGNKKKNNKPLKLFAIFLVVVIIVVTIFFIIKRNNDVEKGITPSSIPNQAEASKK